MKSVAVAAVVAGLLVVAIAAFVVVVTRSPERELTAAELTWVRAFVDWREDRWRSIAVAYEELGSVPDRERTARLAAELGTCSRSFERAVGRAPEALSAVGKAAGDACSAAERSAALLSELGASGLAEARRALLDADQAFVRSDARLDRRLLLRRALPTLEGPAPESRVDPRLSEAATAVSGIPMSVRCWSRSEWPRVNAELASLVEGGHESSTYLGGAGIWDGEPNLAPRICTALEPLLTGGRSARATAGLVRGLTVLAHEIAHASGTVDEAETECRGLQLVRGLATRLGAPQQVADTLAARAWRLYRSKRELLPEYWSARCRPGGPWDDSPGSRWP